VCHHATPQSRKVIASLKAAHNSAVSRFFGNLFEALSHPNVIVLYQAHLAQIILTVGIKACRDQD
jgi:hypothetical protein